MSRRFTFYHKRKNEEVQFLPYWPGGQITNSNSSAQLAIAKEYRTRFGTEGALVQIQLARPMKKKEEIWVSRYGVAGEGTKGKYRKEFDSIQKQLEIIFSKLYDRMAPKELYEVAEQAAVSAVANLVASRSSKKKK